MRDNLVLQYLNTFVYNSLVTIFISSIIFDYQKQLIILQYAIVTASMIKISYQNFLNPMFSDTITNSLRSTV